MGKENGFARVSRSSLLNAILASWGLFSPLCHTSPYSVQRSLERQSVGPLCFFEAHSLPSSLLPSPVCKISAVQVRWQLEGCSSPSEAASKKPASSRVFQRRLEWAEEKGPHTLGCFSVSGWEGAWDQRHNRSMETLC